MMEEKIRYIEILLPSKEPFSKYQIGDSNSISPLSLINIFIGTNNSGKSRFLRALFAFQELSFNTNIYSTQDLEKLTDELDSEFKKAFTDKKSTQIAGLTPDYIKHSISSLNNSISYKFISNNYQEYEILKNILQNTIALSDIEFGYYSVRNYDGATPQELGGSKFPTNIKDIINKLHEIALQFDLRLGEIINGLKSCDKKRYYIPILRGMRPLHPNDQHRDLYAERTINDYFSKDSIPPKHIFTGVELYQTLKNKLLGEPEDRQLVKDFENFLSDNFFESKPVTLIPKELDPKVVHIKIGDEKQFPIYDLGDGLQNLIICTFNIFTESSGCLFFIEEPDIFMHPSLQRAFLEVLSKFDQHQYFVTSHSNHFLDMTIDFANISVFHFSKHEESQSQFRIRPSSPRDRQILLELGVRNSSVFISNATIWVEGITDRLYLKAYMKKYIDGLECSNPQRYDQLNKLKEDYHYSFVEYQGSTLTHWNFDSDDNEIKEIRANYVCSHAFLIADGDIVTKGMREENFIKMLGDRFHLLHVKEIENLIPVEILKQVVTKQFKKYDVNTDLIKYEDYARLDTPIGTYLDNLLSLSKNSLFAAESGTFTSYYKGTVCDNAVKFMKKPEWTLTNDLKDICKKIFDHIITQNKNS